MMQLSGDNDGVKTGATLQDVADHAGVSLATASRALNHGHGVRVSTVEKVRQAAETLDYRPNIAARVLSGGASDLICLIVPNLSRQALSRFYYASLIAGADEAAQRHGLHVLIKNKQEVREIESLLGQSRLGGVLLRVGHNQSLEQRLIQRLRKTRTPFVLIGHAPERLPEPSIRIDIVGGARALAHHFASQGYQRILYVSGPKHNADSNDRYYGFRMGLLEKGYSDRQLITAPGDYSPESGFRAAEEHIREQRIDGVFAATDHTALGVLTYCASCGIRVPDEVGVAGYDDQDYAAYTWPALTTVRQPVPELGQHAIEQLLHVMNSTVKREDRMILAPSLIVRSSTVRR